MKWIYRLIPWFFVALFGAEIVAVMLPKKDGEYHVREFGRLPVLLNGRIQPFDSVARNSLLQIRTTGDVPLEQVPAWKFWHHPKKLKATEWLLEVMTRPEVADTRYIFLIHHSDLLGELKLQDKGIAKSGLRWYTFNDLKPVISVISEQGEKASEVKSEQQTSFQRQVIKLANAVMLYQRLKVTLQPEGVDDFAKELADFKKDLPAAQAAVQASDGGKDVDKEALVRIAQPVSDFKLMAQYGYALVVPPLNPQAGRDQWQNAGASLLESPRMNDIHPVVGYFATMATAYRQHNAGDFNRAVDDYKGWLTLRFDKEIRKGKAEFYFNDVKPFLHAIIIYIFAFILAGAAILTLLLAPGLFESLRRSALYLVILAGVVHTFGLVFRMALEGRPPVTNLYSSAIFIGWGTMVLGIIIERIYRLGIGSLVASFAGFVTLLIAQNLAIGGDTMEMLRAVLDTNFWLATHVVIITYGYAATFSAGLLAILYIFLGVFTPLLRHRLGTLGAAAVALPATGYGGAAAMALHVSRSGGQIELGKALSKMVYGVVCFATLFSFVGTVLGGIWGDQAWGRFWGWDPKENGALLIVLWNAIILHARWGGLIRERGIMNLAVIGNVVTSYSWFGVNLLGIGLHSYGFTDTGAEYLMNFVVSQLVLLGNGIFPWQTWKSFPQAVGNASRGLLRKLLGLLNIGWLLAAITWFIGIYYARPSYALSGRIGSVAALILIWALGWVARSTIVSPGETEASAVLPASSNVGSS